MRRTVFIHILLCAVLLLTACQADDPENLFGTTEGPEMITTADQTDAPIPEDTGYYQYGNKIGRAHV